MAATLAITVAPRRLGRSGALVGSGARALGTLWMHGAASAYPPSQPSCTSFARPSIARELLAYIPSLLALVCADETEHKPHV